MGTEVEPLPTALAPPHSGKLQLLFTMSSTFKASTTWVTFTHEQIWLPAWDAALITMGHSYSVLPLRKYFPKDSPCWCWSLLNPSRSLRPSSPVLTVWLKKRFYFSATALCAPQVYSWRWAKPRVLNSKVVEVVLVESVLLVEIFQARPLQSASLSALLSFHIPQHPIIIT